MLLTQGQWWMFQGSNFSSYKMFTYLYLSEKYLGAKMEPSLHVTVCIFLHCHRHVRTFISSHYSRQLFSTLLGSDCYSSELMLIFMFFIYTCLSIANLYVTCGEQSLFLVGKRDSHGFSQWVTEILAIFNLFHLYL